MATEATAITVVVVTIQQGMTATTVADITLEVKIIPQVDMMNTSQVVEAMRTMGAGKTTGLRGMMATTAGVGTPRNRGTSVLVRTKDLDKNNKILAGCT